MSPGIITLLRVLHIVGGAFWVGTAVFIAAFLGPSLRAAGPAAGPIMSYLTQVRRLPIWMRRRDSSSSKTSLRSAGTTW